MGHCFQSNLKPHSFPFADSLQSYDSVLKLRFPFFFHPVQLRFPFFFIIMCLFWYSLHICWRYKENTVARSLTLQKQLNRYAPISLSAEVVLHFVCYIVLTSIDHCLAVNSFLSPLSSVNLDSIKSGISILPQASLNAFYHMPKTELVFFWLNKPHLNIWKKE